MQAKMAEAMEKAEKQSERKEQAAGGSLKKLQEEEADVQKEVDGLRAKEKLVAKKEALEKVKATAEMALAAKAKEHAVGVLRRAHRVALTTALHAPVIPLPASRASSISLANFAAAPHGTAF